MKLLSDNAFPYPKKCDVTAHRSRAIALVNRSNQISHFLTLMSKNQQGDRHQLATESIDRKH